VVRPPRYDNTGNAHIFFDGRLRLGQCREQRARGSVPRVLTNRKL
jgi:hypothetical protein